VKHRVLVLPGSSGAGHVWAGKPWKRLSPRDNCWVRHEDALHDASKLFQKRGNPILAIAGKADPVCQRLERLARHGSALRLVGFTTEKKQWMAAADLLVAKREG